MMKKVRTRIAPSPTGGMHIGGIRTALFNYLFAKQNGGDFILRLEDTDRDRFEENSEKHIQESLDWCGISLDESPWNPGKYGSYIQSEREYLSFAEKLIELGHAYYAFDSKEELTEAKNKWDKIDGQPGYGIHTRDQMQNSLTMPETVVAMMLGEKDYVIRFKMPSNQNVTFNDKVKGEIRFNTSVLNDAILFKSNGLPSYHLANVVDDHDMEISHVFRGEEWISSTPLHCLLYDAFGWDRPDFGHLPLLLTPDGKKISKRTAHKYGLSVFLLDYDDIDGYKSLGYEHEALLNFLVLLGWSPKNDDEIFSLGDMIKLFDINSVSKAGAKVAKDKLDHFNSHYVRNKDNGEMWLYLKTEHDIIPSQFMGDKERLDLILEVAKERSVFMSDLPNVVRMFTDEITTYEEGSEKKVNDEFINIFKQFLNSDVDYTDQDNVKQTLYDLATDNNVKFGKLMPSLRVAIVGGKSGADLMTSIYILGETESKNRIEKMIEIFG